MALALPLCLTSCRSALRKVAKETMGETAEVVAEKMSKESLEKLFKNLDKSASKKMLKALQDDPELYAKALSPDLKWADFEHFVGDSKMAAGDVNLLRLFVNEGDIFKGAVAHDRDGVMQIIRESDGTLLCEVKDGIVSLRNTFSSAEGIFGDGVALREKLIPNSLYKLREESGAVYFYTVNEFGHVSEANVKKLTPDQLYQNVIMGPEELSLSPKWEEAFDAIRHSSNGNDIDARVVFHRASQDAQPSRIDIDANVNGKPLTKTEINVASRKLVGKEAMDALDDIPSLQSVIRKLKEMSPAYFTDDKLVVEEVDGIRRIRFDGTSTQIDILPDGTIRAKSGSTKKSGEMNEFLNNLLPDRKYEIDGVMTVETDENGLTKSIDCHSSELYNKTFGADNPRGNLDKTHGPDVVRQKGGDPSTHDAGHIQAHATGGPNESFNILPMKSDMQRQGSDWAELERRELDAIKNGQDVHSRKTITYHEDGSYDITVDLTIDGETTTQTFIGLF